MLFSRIFKTAVLALLTGVVAFGTHAQTPLRIGAINPYSGPLALYGDELARGYQLAVDERNGKGGVLGRKIELVRGDGAVWVDGVSVHRLRDGEPEVGKDRGGHVDVGHEVGRARGG